MTHEKIIEALRELTPNAHWVLKGDNLSGLEWLDLNQTRTTNEEIESKVSELYPKPIEE